MKAFEVFLNSRYFDTLYFPSQKTAKEVKDSLNFEGKKVSVRPVHTITQYYR
jgi:hypothetical protein